MYVVCKIYIDNMVRSCMLYVHASLTMVDSRSFIIIDALESPP